jgi:hypothetical protein
LIPQAERTIDGQESAISVDWWQALTEVHFYCRAEGDIYHEGYKVLSKSAPPQYVDRIKHLIPPHKLDLTKHRPYSSLHIHYRVPAPQSYRVINQSVPVEIQIRTAIEDIWAEIDHVNDFKIRNSSVWNEELEEKYALLDNNSLDLKRIMNDLQDKVTSIRNTYYQTQDLFLRFKLPQTETYQSLVMLLAEPLLHRYSPRDVMPLFWRYEELLKSLNPTTPEVEQKAVLASCLDLLGEIRKLFGASRDAIRHDTKDLFDLLLEFETIRLEAVLLSLPIRLYYTQVQAGSSRHASRDARSRQLQQLQFRLNELEAKHWRTRPTVLFNFWNYYIVVNLHGDKNPDARFYLFAAYDALLTDQSLPIRSVYKVVVPRAIAQIYFSEALTLETNYRDSELTSYVFRENLQFLFIMAFRFGSEARREHNIEHSRRGDLIYGRRPIEKVFDEAYFVQYGVKCFEYDLGPELSKVHHVAEGDILKALNELANFQFGDLANDPAEDDTIAAIVVAGYKYFGCIDESEAYRARWEDHCQLRGDFEGGGNEYR